MRPAGILLIFSLSPACATAADEPFATRDGGKAEDAGETSPPDENGPTDGMIFTPEDGEAPKADSGAADTSTPPMDTSPPPPMDTGTVVMDTAPPPPTCTTIEDFESGGVGAWSKSGSGSLGVVAATSAHDGAYGWSAGGSSSITDFLYRASPSVGTAGGRLTAWVRGTGGRLYLGFAASSAGAKSFVIAPNTGDIRFQDNAGWGYTELNTTAVSFTPGKWYLAEVVFGSGGAVTGNLYASDGTTLVATVSQTFAGLAPGGVSIRSFALEADTIRWCP